MSKKASRIIAAIMLIIAVGFVVYALSHPEASVTWNTKGLYFGYLAIMAVLFIIPFKK